MPTVRISQKSVEAATSDRSDCFFWDADLRGFGLKVTAGGSKTYVVQYRMGGRSAQTRRFTLGKHGIWTPATARLEAEKLLRLAAVGIDPQTASKERERVEQELGFRDYTDRFLREYGKRKWRQRTYDSAESNLRRWVVPILGGKPLPQIRRRDITSVLDRVPHSSPALPRNLFALMRKLFTWAVARGDIERSPMAGMESPDAVPSRDRTLTDDELMLVALLAEDLGSPFEQFVRMLIVTGQRREEVAGMQWAELDQTAAMWTLPGVRTKNKEVHRLPLNSIAVRSLDQLAGQSRWPRSGLVFTTTGRTPISGFSKMKRKLDTAIALRSGASIAPWRIHDLRRTFATNMQKLGVRFEVTEALLNHISGSRAGVAGVYQRHDWQAEKANAVRLWAEKLIILVNGLAGTHAGAADFINDPA